MEKRTLVVFLVVAVIACCDLGTEPGLDPHDFTVEATTYACGSWGPVVPSREIALLDIYFGRRTLGNPDDRPREESIAQVEALGGTVIHTFHLPMARAIMSVDSVNALSANFVNGVPDADNFRVEVLVKVETPLSAGDRAFFENIGATDLQEYSLFIRALVPDAAIPAIRKHPGVGYVEGRGINCPD